MRKTSLLLVMVLGLLILAGIAHGFDTFERCSTTNMIHLGDHLDDVLLKCGQPEKASTSDP